MAERRWARLGGPLLLGLALAAGGLGLAAGAARADVAPIPQVGENGHSLGPAAATNVQMVSETVVLEVAESLAFTLTENQFETERPGALVTADFLLRNPDSAAQRLTVGFPMLVPPAFDPNSFGEAATYLIEDLRAQVNGAELPTRQTLVAGGPWRVWEVDLPPGDTPVRVTYRQPADSPSTWSPRFRLGYVLQTGAAWAGVIGRAELIVRFPYPAEDMFVEAGQSGFSVDGNDLRWTYTDLEPTAADDLLLTVVAPSYWRAVLEARRAVAAEPTAANYGALAEAYTAIVLPSRGPYNPDAGPNFASPLIAQVAEAQLRKALDLAPGDGNLHGQYAQFLASLAGSLLPAERYGDAFAEYALAMALGAEDWYRDEYQFILDYSGDQLPAGAAETATAILPITAAPSATLAPSATRPPANTPAPSDTAAPAATPAPSDTPAPAAASRTPAATATAAPTATPAAETAPALPWAAIIGFLFVFAIVVGGLLWLRRRPAP